MPASIHPPVQLNIVLDEESYQGGDSVEMARRFTAVAPTEVVRASKGSQRANVLRFDLGDDVVTAEADDDSLWRDALVTWLDEEFAETSALVARENDARRNNGERVVPFTWAEVKFGTGPVIAIRMKDSSIPPEAAGFVARARQLLTVGTFGSDPIAAIRIPACVSIEAQRTSRDGDDQQDDQVKRDLKAIGREERGSSSTSDIIAAVNSIIDTEGAGASELQGGWSAADPDEQNAWAGSAREQEGPSRAELDDAIAEAEAALRRGDDPTDVDEEDRDRAADAGDDAVDVSAPEERLRAIADDEVDVSGEGCALDDGEVPEHLDYRIWNVAYADGTSVRYDSVLGEALLD